MALSRHPSYHSWTRTRHRVVIALGPWTVRLADYGETDWLIIHPGQTDTRTDREASILSSCFHLVFLLTRVCLPSGATPLFLASQVCPLPGLAFHFRNCLSQ